MIIIRTENGDFYAASAKAVPNLIQEIVGSNGLEKTIQESSYFKFNTRENRTGKVGPFLPLSELVVVSCGLARQENGDDEEEGEEENGE